MSRKKTWKSRAHGGWGNTSRGPGPYVSVYCRGASEQPHDKWRLASFYPDELNDHVYWLESPTGYADSERDVLFTVHPRITQYLVGDRWVGRDDKSARREEGFRLRWSMKCPVCGFSQAYARPLELSDRISQLALLRGDDGVFELSLRAFVSHMR